MLWLFSGACSVVAAPLRPVLSHAATLATRSITPLMSGDVAALISDPLADPVATAFAFVSFVPQPLWLLPILLPNWKVTRAIFEPITPLALLALAHLAIVLIAAQGQPETGTAPLELFNHHHEVAASDPAAVEGEDANGWSFDGIDAVRR